MKPEEAQQIGQGTYHHPTFAQVSNVIINKNNVVGHCLAVKAKERA